MSFGSFSNVSLVFRGFQAVLKGLMAFQERFRRFQNGSFQFQGMS